MEVAGQGLRLQQIKPDPELFTPELGVSREAPAGAGRCPHSAPYTTMSTELTKPQKEPFRIEVPSELDLDHWAIYEARPSPGFAQLMIPPVKLDEVVVYDEHVRSRPRRVPISLQQLHPRRNLDGWVLAVPSEWVSAAGGTNGGPFICFELAIAPQIADLA
jgi:hypothetical protein